MDNSSVLSCIAPSVLLNFIIIVALFALCVQITYKIDIITALKDTVFITSFLNTVIITFDIGFRLCHFLFQSMFVNSECSTSFSSFEDIFQFNMPAVILIVINIILFVCMTISIHGMPLYYITGFKPLAYIPCILLSWSLLRVTNFSNGGYQKTSPVKCIEGLDYGTGMAYSYYYGYLKLILPSTGTATKGLLEKIENAEDNHNITLASQKLIILIPSSSYIPPDLKESSYQWMESAVVLEEQQRDRAGVKRRSYHNNIYKIYPGGQNTSSVPQYVVVEGATPLLTFYEVQKHSHPETMIYKKYHKEVVRKFYVKLKELLENDLDCKDLCELIHYDDYDSNGVKINVAKVILERLSRLEFENANPG